MLKKPGFLILRCCHPHPFGKRPLTHTICLWQASHEVIEDVFHWSPTGKSHCFPLVTHRSVAPELFGSSVGKGGYRRFSLTLAGLSPPCVTAAPRGHTSGAPQWCHVLPISTDAGAVEFCLIGPPAPLVLRSSPIGLLPPCSRATQTRSRRRRSGCSRLAH